jgi:hypothetical protein
LRSKWLKTDLEYWVDADCYSKLLDDHKTGALVSAVGSTPQAILAVGTFYANDTVQLDNWYIYGLMIKGVVMILEFTAQPLTLVGLLLGIVFWPWLGIVLLQSKS